jgi:hypothetical protein
MHVSRAYSSTAQPASFTRLALEKSTRERTPMKITCVIRYQIETFIWQEKLQLREKYCLLG